MGLGAISVGDVLRDYRHFGFLFNLIYRSASGDVSELSLNQQQQNLEPPNAVLGDHHHKLT